MPNFTSWYDVGGFLTSSCFVGCPAAAASTSRSHLVTTTLADGVHLWQLPSAASTLACSMQGGGGSKALLQRAAQEDESVDAGTETHVARLSVSSSSSSEQQPQHVRQSFTCCTATADGSSFLAGTADGHLFQGSLDSTMLYRAAQCGTGGGGGSDAFQLDDALCYIAPLGGGAAAAPLFMTMTVGGGVGIVDLRSKATVCASSPSTAPVFHCGAPLTGSGHIALATDGGNVQLFDLRRTSSAQPFNEAVRTFALKNQVSAMCALPAVHGGISTGFVAGTIAGRVLTVRALDAPLISSSLSSSSSPPVVVREEAVALPCDDRYPITHVAAIQTASQSSSGGSADKHHTIAVVAASSDGSVHYFSKEEFANFEAQQHQRRLKQQQQPAASTLSEPWHTWSWRLAGQHPTSLCLVPSAAFLGGLRFPVLACSYAAKQHSNRMSRVCVVSLCEEKLL